MIKRGKRMYVISISCFIGLIFIAGIGVAFAHPAFGRSPRGERLNRIKQSAHYIDGQFQNTSPTPVMSEEDEKPFKS